MKTQLPPSVKNATLRTRAVLSCIAFSVVAMIACERPLRAQTVEESDVRTGTASHFTDREAGQFTRDFFRAVGAKDLRELESIVQRSHEQCLVAHGRGHVDERTTGDYLTLVHRLHDISPAELEQYWQYKWDSHVTFNKVIELYESPVLNPQQAVELHRRLCVLRQFFRAFEIDPMATMNCEFWLINMSAVSWNWAEAHRLAEQFLTDWAPKYPDGDLVVAAVSLMDAQFLMELSSDFPKQVDLLRSFIAFADRFAYGGRLPYFRERGLAALAEVHYRNGNHAEADRLFGEVCSRVPDPIDNMYIGWCKSCCDRHEARELMDQGDWDGAFHKIVQAQTGAIDYGNKCFDKGIVMERMFRMSAEIQRKRGNDKEAEADLRFAERIAENAARLREALEPELRLLDADAAKTPATRSVPAEATGQ